ncbi:LOW QUALITY PROTEIN: mesothelin-like [Ochotona curzoniae]|uniref:LOW QUALITY PROTEIN: mesothelin-like n=1 Tax=Ochotona curzoniae TaxID=130825 RepID=UPI001B3518B9|nr:LOW QUALITY PROTEIN: mesothelin-like [Ochotona curzoniae]
MAWTAALLLLPLLSLRWVLFLGAQAVQTPQDPTLLDRVLSASDIASSTMGPGPQACASFLSRLAQANMDVLLSTAAKRQRLLSVALACRAVGVLGERADLWGLGSLACELPGCFEAGLAKLVLSRLEASRGPWTIVAVQAEGPGLQHLAPPTWSVSTLVVLGGLLGLLSKPDLKLGRPFSVQGVLGTRLHPAFLGPDWKQAQLTMVHPRLRRDTQKAACPPGRKPAVVDENLFFYADWELEVCVDGRLLAAQMDRVNSIPFTYQQLDILKRRLDESYPQGYPESLTRRLGHFFLAMSLEDIHKWNVTSVDTVTALLRASRGRRLDAQVAALIFRYMMGRNWLDQEVLDALAGFRPLYLCVLSPEQLVHLPPSAVESVGPQDLDTCSPQQLAVLYPKALLAFRNASGPGYTEKIQSFLGGASTDDLRALIWRNVSVDIATFRKLRVEALVPLTVAEVQSLLGPHVVDLKSEAHRSPVRDWICRQLQEDLDTLQLGLLGGVPSGYLLLDLTLQETHSGAPRLCPGQLLATMVPLLLTLPSR